MEEYNTLMKTTPSGNPSCPDYTKYFYYGETHDMTFKDSKIFIRLFNQRLQHKGWSDFIVETESVLKPDGKRGKKVHIYLKKGITFPRLFNEEKSNPAVFKEIHHYSQYQSIDKLAFYSIQIDEQIPHPGLIGVKFRRLKVNGITQKFNTTFGIFENPKYTRLKEIGKRYVDLFPEDFTISAEEAEKNYKDSDYEIDDKKFILKKPKWVMELKKKTKLDRILGAPKGQEMMDKIRSSVYAIYPIVIGIEFIQFYKHIPGGTYDDHFDNAVESVKSYLISSFVKNAEKYRASRRNLQAMVNNFEHLSITPFNDSIYINSPNFSLDILYDRYCNTIALKDGRHGTNFKFGKLLDVYKSYNLTDDYSRLKEIIKEINTCKHNYDNMKRIRNECKEIFKHILGTVRKYKYYKYDISEETITDTDIDPDAISWSDRTNKRFMRNCDITNEVMDQFEWEDEEREKVERELVKFAKVCFYYFRIGEYHLCFFSLDDFFHLRCNNYIEKFENLHEKSRKKTDEEFENNKSEFEYIADELKYDRMVTSIMRDYNIDDTKEYIKKQIEIIRQQRQNI